MEQMILRDEAKGFELLTIKGNNGQILYDASCVCKKLGYTNLAQELRYIPEEYKFKFRGILTNRGTPKIYLNKFGLELMVMRCRKPIVWPYQKWVIEEVLESVYKNGGYVMGQEKLTEDERNALTSQIKQLSDIVKTQGDKLKELEHFAKTQNIAYNKLKDRVFDLANDLQNGPDEPF